MTQLAGWADRALTRRKQGWSLTADFIETAHGIGAIPFFNVVEKNYQLAERVVHALLDPETNPHVKHCPVPGSPDYEGLVDFLYQLPESALATFGAAVVRPSEEAVRAGIEAIVAALAPLDERLAHAISGGLTNLKEVIDTDFSDRVGFKHEQLTSPHLPGVMRMLEAADAYAESHQFGAVDVLHDETAQYADVLMRYFALLAGIGATGKVPHVAPHLPHIGLAHLRTMQTLASHEHGGIQAADLLATSLSKVVLVSCSSGSWTSAQSRVATELLGRLLKDDLTHGGVSASARFKVRLRARLLASPPQ